MRDTIAVEHRSNLLKTHIKSQMIARACSTPCERTLEADAFFDHLRMRKTGADSITHISKMSCDSAGTPSAWLSGRLQQSLI
jgi:hypothetical protein